jgi:pyruvate dehydrogenase E2 component (dihydrolipoamide acetyltransferase)
VGDEVQADQPMVSVETAKAVVEIPAPYAGRIARLFGKPGEVAHLGAPLVGFEGDDSAAQSVSVVGRVDTADSVPPAARQAPGNAAGIKAAPAVRALARSLGVDLALAVASGPEGAVTTADVERAAKESAGLPPLQPLGGVARAMAQSMTRAHAEVAAATVVDDADVDAWAAHQPVLPRLVRALLAGVRAEPSLNAWYDARLVGRHRLEHVDVGLAVDTADGLLVPVLRGAEKLAGAALDQAVAQLVEAARARTVAPQDLRGCSITLSNFGSIAGRYATPVVVPPTVAILGAGRVRDEVVARNRQAVVRRILPLSLSFDHRCVTGGEAARFLAAVISDLAAAR